MDYQYYHSLVGLIMSLSAFIFSGAVSLCLIALFRYLWRKGNK